MDRRVLQELIDLQPLADTRADLPRSRLFASMMGEPGSCLIVWLLSIF
jgi:hypothetical protein